MRLPALNLRMGDWNYYSSTMTFEEISTNVRKIDNQLHKSERLSELIQRSITENYINIKKYIDTHEDRFFNSIVLAVYEGDPQFLEIDFEHENVRYGQMGLLDFTGHEIIFPVDGQHRVEGIKAALDDNSNLKDNQISVIFIGHSNTPEGLKRTRRLFTTLNRYAKPVKKSDIIALDEDDLVAITTRYLVDNHDLFNGKKISLERTLQENDQISFTTIETLYDCNNFLLSNFLKDKGITKKNSDFKTSRPSDSIIREFQNYCISFWNHVTSSFDILDNYANSSEEYPAAEFRNRNGGNLLFRPVGLSSFIKSVSNIKQMHDSITYSEILGCYSDVQMNMSCYPWKGVIWNEQDNKMILNNKTPLNLINLFIFEKKNNNSTLTSGQREQLIERLSTLLSLTKDEVNAVLDDLISN